MPAPRSLRFWLVPSDSINVLRDSRVFHPALFSYSSEVEASWTVCECFCSVALRSCRCCHVICERSSRSLRLRYWILARDRSSIFFYLPCFERLCYISDTAMLSTVRIEKPSSNSGEINKVAVTTDLSTADFSLSRKPDYVHPVITLLASQPGENLLAVCFSFDKIV